MPLTEDERKQRTREARRAREKANPEKVRESKRAWKARNVEAQRIWKAEWRARNREKNRETEAAWRARNLEKVRAAKAAWRARNLEKVRAYERQKYLKVRAKRIASHEIDRRHGAAWSKSIVDTITRAVPADWPYRAEVISDVALALFEGEIAQANIAEAVAKAGRHYRNLGFKELSLDEPAYDGGPNRVDLLIGADPREDGSDEEES